MPRYVILIEKGEHNYSAYVPDVDGCVTTGATIEETIRNMKEALEGHFELMQLDGDPLPEPTIIAAEVDVDYPPTPPVVQP